ncbi:MAG: hypothetical protein ACO2ZM_08350, partial [Francisellaceae bacterium]
VKKEYFDEHLINNLPTWVMTIIAIDVLNNKQQIWRWMNCPAFVGIINPYVNLWMTDRLL